MSSKKFSFQWSSVSITGTIAIRYRKNKNIRRSKRPSFYRCFFCEIHFYFIFLSLSVYWYSFSVTRLVKQSILYALAEQQKCEEGQYLKAPDLEWINCSITLNEFNSGRVFDEMWNHSWITTTKQKLRWAGNRELVLINTDSFPVVWLVAIETLTK